MPVWKRTARLLFYVLGLYLIVVNLFQIGQYNSTILHCTDMNMGYYARIYLNPHPTPQDMSLLDTNDYLGNESKYKVEVIAKIDSLHHIKSPENTPGLLLTSVIKPDSLNKGINEEWLKVEAEIKTDKGFWGGYLSSEVKEANSIKRNRVRLFSPISWDAIPNKYVFYIRIPDCSIESTLRLFVYSKSEYEGDIENIKITSLKK